MDTKKHLKPNQEMEDAAESLKAAVIAGCDWQKPLWNCVRAWQNVEFMTAGRGSKHLGSTAFTYILKISSRTGLETDELIVSTRKQAKTITKSSVERALLRALEEQREHGCVEGPKRLGGFGSSYLYSMFLKWGVIRSL